MIVEASHEPRYVALVLSFPVLGGRDDGLGPAPGVDVDGQAIDLDMLDRWAAGEEVFNVNRGPFPGRGAEQAASFCLRLWNSRNAWRCPAFNLFAALRAWDDDQRRAFQAWAANPFLP